MEGRGQQAVISASELSRIKTTLLQNDGQTKQEKAMSLHEKSKARAAKWTNTLEGSRRKKAELKQKAIEEQEQEKLKIDREEAKLQQNLRRHAIERANKLLYEDSDRMKSFHSKMMQADVIAEREAQVKLKEELVKLEQIREERFLEMEKQNYRGMLERELREKASLGNSSKIAAKVQAEQLQEVKDKFLRDVEDQILEGDMLRMKAAEDLEAERLAEKKRRAQAVQALHETQKANEYLKQIKADDAMRQAREDDKIREYAQQKEQMIELRKKRESEVFAHKQQQRQKMVDRQAAQLAAMKNNENQRLERQVLEKEIKDEEARLAKEEKMRKWQDDIDRSRRFQIERKRQARANEKEEEHELATFWKEWCGRLDDLDVQERNQRRLAGEKLAQEQLKQAKVKQTRDKEEHKQGLTIAKQAREAMEADTLAFHEYAETVIKEYATEGKNIIPMIQELREFRKRVLE